MNAAFPQVLRDFSSKTICSAGTPREIIAKLNGEIGRVLAEPETRELLLKQGAEPTPMEPAALRQLMQSEYARWGKVIREAHIKVD